MNNKVILAAILFCCATLTQGQVTDPNNLPISGNFVGFNGNSIIPLPIENIGYPDINISSNGNNKFAITELPTWNGLNGLTRDDVKRTTMGLQGEIDTAWSMLHLWSGELTSTMQRDWMNVGTSYTANIDFMYTGLLERPVTGGAPPRTDAVIAWGCQDGPIDPDNFRFLFLSPTGASGPSSSEQGLETMRISPVGNVGIGDFSSMPTGLNEQPTQKLDVDGTARLRQMPNESPDVIITGVEEVEEGDYRLNYLEFSGNSNDVLTGDGTWIDGSGTLCDWDVVNGGNDVAMGYGAACVTEQMLVGTDLQTGTNAKVFMTKDYTGTTLRAEATSGSEFTDQIAGYFKAKGGVVNYGVQSLASNALGSSFGLRGEATNSIFTYGVSGFASEASQVNYGVNGTASGGFGENPPVNNVGVYGRALGYASTFNFEGYFVACDGTKNIGLYAQTWRKRRACAINYA